MLAPVSHLGYLAGLNRHKAHHLSELLPWFALLGTKQDPYVYDGLVITKDEALCRTYRVNPLDLMRLSSAERGHLVRRLNEGWKLLEGSQWAIWHDATEVSPPAYLDRAPEAAIIPRLLDEDRQREYETPGAYWETEIFLSVWYRPIGEKRAMLNRVLYTNDGEPTDAWDEARETYDTTVTQFVDVLGGACHEIEPLDTDGVLTYLHNLVSDTPHPVFEPEMSTHLDYWLADSPLVTGILHPKLGDKYLACISLRSLPKRTTTSILTQVHALGFYKRLVSRWVPTSAEAVIKELSTRENNWRSKAQGIGAMLYSFFDRGGSRAEDDIHVTKSAHETNVIRDRVGSQHMILGDLNLTIVLADEDRKVLKEQIREVQRVAHRGGCITIRESLNAVEAWLGTLVGNPQVNPRHYRVGSYNTLHLQTWTRGYRGQMTTAELKAPALMIATRNQCQPFHFSPFVQDVANMFVLGPIGSGKSALLSWLVAMWLVRYVGAQVFWFDIKRAGRCLALCLGANYYELGPKTQVGFQPYRLVHILAERSWAHRWTMERLKEEGMSPDTVEWEVAEGYIRTVIDGLSRRPMHQRTITGLVQTMDTVSQEYQRHRGQTPADVYKGYVKLYMRIRAAMAKFTRGNEAGFLLDADHDDLSDGRVQVFEREQLLETPDLVPAFESYAWHRIYPLLDGSPTLVPIDEFGMSIKHKTSLAYVEQGLRLNRDKHMAFLLATQDPLDILRPGVTDMLEISCHTRFFMPNASAMDRGPIQAYEALGLGHQDIRELAGATPKKHAFIQQRPLGSGLIDVTLPRLGRDICGRSSQADHRLMDRLLQQHGREDFTPAWLYHFGYEEEAHAVEQWQKDTAYGVDRNGPRHPLVTELAASD